MKLDLNDLKPQEALFELSAKPGAKFTLRPFSLRAQVWVNEKYGEEKLKQIFETQHLGAISEIAYFLLKEKDVFPTQNDFFDSILTLADKVAVVTAMLETIGISQPIMARLSKEYDAENPKNPSEPTGANTTTA